MVSCTICGFTRDDYKTYVSEHRCVPKDKQALCAAFKLEISDRARQIDEHADQDWYSLTIGWGIAKGLSPEQAIEFATLVRYKTDLA